MKSISNLWVGALWQAAMPLENEAQALPVTQTARTVPETPFHKISK
ncbi:hypothetical protein [Shewanella sp. Actino-trap-3]|nr:hypothetical protein [Shewanella sp. Actino-trap-3]